MKTVEKCVEMGVDDENGEGWEKKRHDRKSVRVSPFKYHNYPPMLHSEILQHRTKEGTPLPVRGSDPFTFYLLTQM